jgi:preprotein translocase subunit YajC
MSRIDFRSRITATEVRMLAVPRRLVIAAAILFVATERATAQTRVATLDELRRALAPGDRVIVTDSQGASIHGRVRRVREDGLEIRGKRDATIPFAAMQSLERPRDPARDGMLLGAGIGAGIGGALFVYALAVDRNEFDEWAPTYLGLTGVSALVGAVVGRALDGARSKPAIVFDRRSSRTAFRLVPITGGRHGAAIVWSF